MLPLGSSKKRDTSLVPWAVFSIVERRRVPTVLRRVGCMVGWPRKYECDGSSRCLRSLLSGPLRACFSVDQFSKLLSLTTPMPKPAVYGTRPHALTLLINSPYLLHFSYCISLVLSLFFYILFVAFRAALFVCFTLLPLTRSHLRSDTPHPHKLQTEPQTPQLSIRYTVR